MRISLTEKDFEALVNGDVITKTVGKKKYKLEIVLQDIGFANMKNIIELATFRKMKKEGHTF